jgi:hypothetical protein
MKKIILLVAFTFINLSCFAQDTEAPTAPTGLSTVFFQNTNGTAVLFWNSATDNTAVTEYDIYVNNNYYESVVHITGEAQHDVVLFDLFNTSYCFYVVAKDAASNISNASNIACFTRYDDSDQYPVDLYISGIANGTGANKVLEVTNYTGVAIDLSDYSLHISSDGNTTWQGSFTFPANTILADGDVFVIGRSGGNYCNSVYDIIDDTITNFDGNDAIGLFKNGVLLDVIGNLGDNTTFINMDQVMFKSTADNSGNATYDESYWNARNMTNTCDSYMGQADFYVLDTEESEVNTFQIYPNPTNGNSVYIQTKNNTEITEARMYDITGKLVLQQANPSNKINVEGLQRGMYILQLQIGNQTVNKKLIKQ